MGFLCIEKNKVAPWKSDKGFLISSLQMLLDMQSLSSFTNVVIYTMLVVCCVLPLPFFKYLLYDTVLFLCNRVMVVSGAGRTGAALVFCWSPQIGTEEYKI